MGNNEGECLVTAAINRSDRKTEGGNLQEKEAWAAPK
jgi:hypothetical protein